MFLVNLTKTFSLIIYILGFLIDFISKIGIKKIIYFIYFFFWNAFIMFSGLENTTFCENSEFQNFEENKEEEEEVEILNWKYCLGFTIIGSLLLYTYFNYGQNSGFFDRGPLFTWETITDINIFQRNLYRHANYRGARALAPIVLSNLHGRISTSDQTLMEGFAWVTIQDSSFILLKNLDWLLLNIKNGYWSNDLNFVTGYISIYYILTEPFSVKFKNVSIALPPFLVQNFIVFE